MTGDKVGQRVRRAPALAPDRSARSTAPRAASRIYDALHSDIVHMRLRPKTPLIEKELCERFAVSRTPVREALLRLSDEGLVDIFPQSGTYVARIPRRALYEAILIRRALEATSLTLAMVASTPSDLMRLADNLDRLKAAARTGDIEAFHLIDTAFHRSIAEIAGYPGIWNVVQQVKSQIDRYRTLTLPRDGRLDLVVEEHQAILDAMKQSDCKAAVEAMDRHIGRLLQEVENHRDLDPELFIVET
ncbi:GntR family transcriptional regulator (plasmid) [Peteryoungia desertarenae]|uniref:GntR family transcriptional regulator n=1 Tax=Peteryoungia desertarenae TaxID=1813451 RepID=A0ABX6QSN8_9HYPH|nr:GntR family transcriptional regulator [Peteryoungia desertarenae]QLF71568.1 GntR family transcriptional regulator [Peteryoungia desertarenae]